MPKKIGFLKEKVVELDNCIGAVLEGTKNLRKTKSIRNIRDHAEDYGKLIKKIIEDGWIPGECREKIINEGTGHKIRHLRIPNTIDHLVHVAIMRPLIPELVKRYDFYSCGSVDGRGQKRVGNALRGWMAAEKPPKYGGEADVHHAYESTKDIYVMIALRKFVKDEWYLAEIQKILNQMGGTLAIGFQPSHWLFNLVVTDCDREIRRRCKGIKMVRYMDNYVFLSNRKRTVHKAIRVAVEELGKIGLTINDDWQVYPTSKRAVSALSYRYYQGYTVLRKATMYNITRGIKTASKKPCAHQCRSAMSRIGLLRHCNSYNYRKNHVYPVLSIKMCKELISNEDKKCKLRRKAESGNGQPDREERKGES